MMTNRNERGIIANLYHELQGLETLRRSREAFPLPRASSASALRAVFQAADLALLNLADLTRRATADVRARELGRAMTKLSWSSGFHRVLVRLGMIPSQLGDWGEDGERRAASIRESTAFGEYAGALRDFDREVRSAIDSGALDARSALSSRSLDSAELRLFHLIRINNHDATSWERGLSSVPVPARFGSYEELVVTRGMREAVRELALTGDTYFTQFRGLHQIPETLGEEVNDCIEAAIRLLRARDARGAFEPLRRANLLVETILAAVPAMVDNLTTADYHEIRENLGMTSGSHSVCLHFHMFRDLYGQLAEAVLAQACGLAGETDGRAAMRRLSAAAADDAQAWALCAVAGECARFRAFVHQWREFHLHLPRNQLGGQSTRSLVGAADALAAVEKMRNVARAGDPMHFVDAAPPGGAVTLDLTEYLRGSEESLDRLLLAIAGEVTQERFEVVQKREGFFAGKCPFVPPLVRKVDAD